MASHSADRPFEIRLLMVVCHVKINGKHTFALRALGHQQDQAHTVHKTYEQYHDLSQRLASDLSHLANQNRLPRLTKKVTLFFTRPSIAQRQEELDNWVRCIIKIPEVRDHPALSDFLYGQAMPQQLNARSPLDLSINPPPLPQQASSSSCPRPSLSLGRSTPSPSRTDFLTKELPPTPAFANRPALAHKRSTPNMRQTPSAFESDIPPTPMLPPAHYLERRSPPPPLGPSSAGSLASRPSMDSVARSVSTDHTITPSTLRLSRQFSGRASPALSAGSPPPPPEVSSDKQHLGAPRTLRNFMSLQDLRQTVRPTFSAAQTHLFENESIGMTRSTSSQNSLAANLGHQAVPEVRRPVRTSPSSSSRSLARTNKHKHSGSGSSTKSANSLGFSQSSSSSLSGETGFDMSLGNSSYTSSTMSSNEPSFSFESGPGSPASLSQPQTPPSPHWLEMPPTAKSLDFEYPVREVLTSTMVPLPSNFTFGDDRPFRTRTASRPKRPSVESPSRSASLPTTPMAHEANTSDASILTGDSVIIKAKHGQEIVMAKVARGCRLRDVKCAIIDRFHAHMVHLDESIQLTRSSKPRAGEPAQMPLRTEEDWQAASATAAKITLLC